MKNNLPRSVIWDNPRLYVLLFSSAFSVLIAAYIYRIVPNSELAIVRVNQAYGYMSVLLLYLALLVSPIKVLTGNRPFVRAWVFCRRAICVSAAYFTLLHFIVAFFGQLDGVEGLAALPIYFLFSLLLGAFALLFLLLLALTSFDTAVKELGIYRWKWLHRLVYISGVLIVLHVWMVGTYVAVPAVQLIAFLLVGTLLALEMWRVVKVLSKRFLLLQERDYALATWATLTGCTLVLLLGIPALAGSYHQDRHGERSAYVSSVQ